MVLTAKQQRRLAAAPPAQKAALRATFTQQNVQPKPRPAQPKAAPKRTIAAVPKKMMMPFSMNPMHPSPMPSITSDGRSLPYTGLVSDDFQVHGKRTLLITTNLGDTGTVGCLLHLLSDDTVLESQITPTPDTAHVRMLTIPTLSMNSTQGGPTSSRAMKYSTSVVNCSAAFHRAGRVTYLNTSQRLPGIGKVYDSSNVARLDFSSIVNAVKTSPYRRRITGATLGEPKQIIGHASDVTMYSNYRPFQGSYTPEEFLMHVVVPGDGLMPGNTWHGPGYDTTWDKRPMSTTVYIFEPTEHAQDYSVTARGSFYTRWPLTSVPGQSMTNSPTAPAPLVNKTHDHAENTANELVHVAEGGALVAAAPTVAKTAKTALQAAQGAMRGLMRGAHMVEEVAQARVPGLGAAEELEAIAVPLAELAL